MKEWQKFSLITSVFLLAYLVPFEAQIVRESIMEAFFLLQEYAREHVIFCLIPAFFIAGAIANFISQGAVIKYFGAGARLWLAYTVASVSGTILAVCSCTVLPLFTGIYKRGAGIGPAVAFLYSGPAINILAIILTARVLGWELGLARAMGAVIFAVLIGLLMAVFYREEDRERLKSTLQTGEEPESGRQPWQNIIFFAFLVALLVFATWGTPTENYGIYYLIYRAKWVLAGISLLSIFYMTWRWFNRDERTDWVRTTWDFALQIMPLLFAGVMVAGLLMGRPESDAGLIPARYIETLLGGNGLLATFIAAIIGSFMYFATLTEIPILQGLIGSGMGKGPALALLLAGPALSLPNMLVIRSVLGTKKTITFVVLVVIMATISGLIYGNIF